MSSSTRTFVLILDSFPTLINNVLTVFPHDRVDAQKVQGLNPFRFFGLLNVNTTQGTKSMVCTLGVEALPLLLTAGLPTPAWVYVVIHGYVRSLQQYPQFTPLRLAHAKERFNDLIGKGGDTTISSPRWSQKQPLPEIGLHDPLHGRQACPEFLAVDQGVVEYVPGRGCFHPVTSHNGDKFVTPPPPPPQSLNG